MNLDQAIEVVDSAMVTQGHGEAFRRLIVELRRLQEDLAVAESAVVDLMDASGWISVDDRLPEIPEGRFGVQVIAATFDAIYDHFRPGEGYSVRRLTYASTRARNGETLPMFEGITKDFDFMDYYLGDQICMGPVCDPVTYWMPMPDPPTS